MGKEQRAVYSGGLVVEVVAEVLLKLGLNPSRVAAVVDELLHRRGLYLRMEETKRAEGHWHADIARLISTASWKTDSETDYQPAPCGA